MAQEAPHDATGYMRWAMEALQRVLSPAIRAAGFYGKIGLTVHIENGKIRLIETTQAQTHKIV